MGEWVCMRAHNYMVTPSCVSERIFTYTSVSLCNFSSSLLLPSMGAKITCHTPHAHSPDTRHAYGKRCFLRTKKNIPPSIFLSIRIAFVILLATQTSGVRHITGYTTQVSRPLASLVWCQASSTTPEQVKECGGLSLEKTTSRICVLTEKLLQETTWPESLCLLPWRELRGGLAGDE